MLGDSVSSPAYAQLKFRGDVSPKKPHNCTFNMIMLIFSGLQLNSLVGARTKLIFSLNLQELVSTLFQLLGKSKEDKSSIKFSSAGPSLESLDLSLATKKGYHT